MEYYTKTSDMINQFNIAKEWWEVITLWTRPSENDLFCFREIQYHFVYLGPLPDVIELSFKVYVGMLRNKQIDIISIFAHNIAN